MMHNVTIHSTGSGEAFNVGTFLEETSPHAWALTGVGLNIGLSVIGAGWSVVVAPSLCYSILFIC